MASQSESSFGENSESFVLVESRGSACVLYIWQYIRGLQNSSSHSAVGVRGSSWFGWSSGLQSVGLFESAVRQSGSEACRLGLDAIVVTLQYGFAKWRSGPTRRC